MQANEDVERGKDNCNAQPPDSRQEPGAHSSGSSATQTEIPTESPTNRHSGTACATCPPGNSKQSTISTHAASFPLQQGPDAATAAHTQFNPEAGDLTSSRPQVLDSPVHTPGVITRNEGGHDPTSGFSECDERMDTSTVWNPSQGHEDVF